MNTNFVPYAGTSLGHIGGGALLAALIGAFLVISIVELGPKYLNPLNRLLALIVAGGAVIALTFFGWRQLASVMRDVDFTINRWGWERLIEANDEQFLFIGRPGWGIGPDPYCGFEYASAPELVVADPDGSGAGYVERLGGDWYWICAA